MQTNLDILFSVVKSRGLGKPESTTYLIPSRMVSEVSGNSVRSTISVYRQICVGSPILLSRRKLSVKGGYYNISWNALSEDPPYALFLISPWPGRKTENLPLWTLVNGWAVLAVSSTDRITIATLAKYKHFKQDIAFPTFKCVWNQQTGKCLASISPDINIDF